MGIHYVCPVCGNEISVNYNHIKETCKWCRKSYWISWNKGHVELKEVMYSKENK